MTDAAFDATIDAGVARLRSGAERAWDRIDRLILRLQGRVDTPRWDQWLPWAWATITAALLVVLALARFQTLRLGVETAKYTQAVWQISEGVRPETTLADGHILAEQASFIVYPLSLITSVLPRTETLLTLKALALALTIVPLWRLARRHGNLGMGATSAVVFAFSIYWAVHAMNAADFVPSMLAVPALMGAVLYGFDERHVPMIAAIVFALACRSDLGLAVAGLGALLLIERRQIVGSVALLLGGGWFLVAMYAVQRNLGDGYAFLEPYAEFGLTPLRALWGILSSPLQFLGLVFDERNFQVVVSLLAPVLFLPLTAPRYLLPAVPLYTLYIGADVPIGLLRESAQTVPMTVFVFVATVFALRRTGRVLVKEVRVDRRVVIALLLTALVFFVADSSTSPYNRPWQWNDLTEIDEVRFDAIALLEDPDELVRASAPFLPQLAERHGVWEIDADHRDQLRIGEVEGVTADVDWLLLEPETEGISEAEMIIVRVALVGEGWERQTIARDVDSRLEVWRFSGVLANGSR